MARSRRRRGVAALARAAVLTGFLAWEWGCGEEPKAAVTRATEDGRFSLTLEARKNSLKRGESLNVKVTVQSLQGPLEQTLRDTVLFVANAGTVTPSRLVFTLVGATDSLYQEATTTYSDWVTYTVSTQTTQASRTRQGEVQALFQDLEAVLKIRIVED